MRAGILKRIKFPMDIEERDNNIFMLNRPACAWRKIGNVSNRDILLVHGNDLGCQGQSSEFIDSHPV